MRGPQLSGFIFISPAEANRFLGRPVRVLSRLGLLSYKTVRFVFKYFPALWNKFKYDSDMFFKLKFLEIYKSISSK
jgi:hypothetical protein